jgi:hypothetical protein
MSDWSDGLNNKFAEIAASLHPPDSGRPALLSSSACANQFYQLGSDLVQGQDKINIAGLDRSLRHAEILRRGPVLSDDLAALLLDDLHPE